MPDLPQVVERLEAHAAAARVRVEELDALDGECRRRCENTPESSVARATRRSANWPTPSRRSRRCGSICLRLHGGAVDLRPITTVLEAARELGDQLDRLAEAQREVDEVRRPPAFDLRSTRRDNSLVILSSEATKDLAPAHRGKVLRFAQDDDLLFQSPACAGAIGTGCSAVICFGVMPEPPRERTDATRRESRSPSESRAASGTST